MQTVKIGSLKISKIILGGNPFSGFSHQTPERDAEMVAWYTTARIKEAYAQAESLGVNTFLGRADKHIRRVLTEYWNEGGNIQWFAQTAPEFSSLSGNVAGAISTGAKAVYIHGGQMDFLYANDQLDILPDIIKQIKDAGCAAGVAGHTPDVHLWANENLDLDFHMCSYYNPSNRAEHAAHDPFGHEVFDDQNRVDMTAIVPQLKAPVIHYKIFAAGRKTPRQGFEFAVKHARPQDAICVGIFTKDKADMLAEDIAIYEDIVENI